MIHVPRLSHVPFDALIAGGVGFALGHLSKVDAKLSALTLAVASVANYLLFKSFDCFFRHAVKVKDPAFASRAIYVTTNFVISSATIIAAKYFELLSNRMTVVCLFGSLGYLAVRLKLLNQ